ncbi:MAG: DUF934 domain-containing protein [Halioglobus sp.]|nr:DUF934 domain-containing protein [Halioglobus sp.]
MPRLIRDGVVIEESAGATPISLAEWETLADKSGSAVQLEPGDDLSPLLEHLESIDLVAINFPAFTDGRGFTYARELRDRGYRGEIRAVGHFIRDQLTYLTRVGVNAFEPAGDFDLDEAVASLADFSEFYQASINEPLPLFRRRT